MARGGLLASLKGFDAFGKTMEDVKIKTRTGALLTMISAAIICTFTLMEFVDYRRLYTDTSVIVDRSRGERLTVSLNITFPQVPCYLLSLDVMDISGDYQTNVNHNIVKNRLDERGQRIYDGNVNVELKNELDKVAAARGPGYCGSCYGGEEPESGCCNSCDQVRQAYLLRGWSFSNPETIDQCVTEHWVEGIHEQAKEGCNIVGSLTVNKVIGNIHLSPGRSFLTNSFNIHDLVPYLKNENPHTFGHIIHEFSFENESQLYKRHLSEEMKRRLGIVYSPLDTTGSFHPDVNNMYQYFLKVVSTRYHFLDESFVSSHQFSVTTYERNLAEGYQHKGTDGVTTTHGITGMPGVFFNFEISPMMVVHHERRQSFAHFLTSMCAIIGGVLTVASMVDSLLFQTGKVIKKGVQAVAVEKDQSQSRSQFLQRPSGFGSSIKMT